MLPNYQKKSECYKNFLKTQYNLQSMKLIPHLSIITLPSLYYNVSDT